MTYTLHYCDRCGKEMNDRALKSYLTISHDGLMLTMNLCEWCGKELYGSFSVLRNKQQGEVEERLRRLKFGFGKEDE